MTPVAVFDVDKTLLGGSSGGRLLDHLWKRGAFTAEHKRLIVAEFARRRLFGAPAVRVVELGARMLYDLDVDEVRSIARHCVATDLSRRLYREALNEIELNRARGMKIILASGSPGAIIEPLGEHVGADLAIGSRSEIVDGRFTERVLTPLPYKHGKRDLVIGALDGERIDWEASTAYSDLAIDIPLLEHVGRPIAVNPTGTLRTTATERGWEIRRWRHPVGSGARPRG